MTMRKICFWLIPLLLLAAACSKKEGTQPSPAGGGSTPPKDYTISGKVSAQDGTPIPDVVVSDGLHCYKTDADGKYYLQANLATTEYVIVSTPSNYAAPVKDGHAIFWQFLKDCTAGADGKYDIPFTLTKIKRPERYTVFIFADPQPRKGTAGVEKYGYKSLGVCDDMYRDMKEYAATMTDRPVYGIGLGDIVHQDLTLLPAYRNGMSGTGITTYNVIGNHDHGHRFMDDAEASKDYEAVMGPTNYSFNLGGIHYLMLDNMISASADSGKYCDECTTGLTDAIWEWVVNDLSYVSFDTPIMVCAHSPMIRTMDNANRTGPHLSDLKNLLGKYTNGVYAWAGHAHVSYNQAGDGIETHTVSRVTGQFWTNEFLGANGTPRGYVVFDYDNGDFSWKFKPLYYQTGDYIPSTVPTYEYRDWDYVGGKAVLKSTGKPLDDTYQMQLFGPGLYEDGYVYANVFLWDEKWKKPVFTSDGVPQTMTRVTEKNFQYSYSDWDLTKFYIENNSWLAGQWSDERNDCASIFKAIVLTEHGTGTVSVKDRFGNTHTSSITW